MKNADEAELQLLASRPLDITVHNVQDFPQLGTLAGLLSRLVCQKVQGRSRAPGERRVAVAGQGPLAGCSPARPCPPASGKGAGRLRPLWGTPCAPSLLGSRGSEGSAARTTPAPPGSACQGGQGEPVTQAARWAVGHSPPCPTVTSTAGSPSSPDTLFTPTSLVVTQVTSSSVHLSWTPAPQLPLKYRIVWQPSRGGAPREVRRGSGQGHM